MAIKIVQEIRASELEADEIIKNAQLEVENILSNAKLKASEILEKAEVDARQEYLFIVNKADEEARKESIDIKKDNEKDIKAIKHAAQEKMDEAINLIVSRTVR